MRSRSARSSTAWCASTATGQVVRPALLWNDVRSADAARALVDELGGARAWAQAVGVVPLAAITVAKLRWLADNEPRHADRTAAVCLPHDWLTWRLRCDEPGHRDADHRPQRRQRHRLLRRRRAAATAVDLLELALHGRRPELPNVLGPSEQTSSTGKDIRRGTRRQRRRGAGPRRRRG